MLLSVTPRVKLASVIMSRCQLKIDSAGAMPKTVLRAADFRDARVLEVGTGDGRLTFQYAAETRSVLGIDIKEWDIRARGPFPANHFEIVPLASSL